MELSRNVMGWFEIPVTDMDRAKAFYEKVFGYEIELSQMGEFQMGLFPSPGDLGGAMGALVLHESYVPSQEGALLYFTAFSGDLTEELSRVEEAGGTKLTDKTNIGDEHGHMALFLDTEGNKVAIHSRT